MTVHTSTRLLVAALVVAATPAAAQPPATPASSPPAAAAAPPLDVPKAMTPYYVALYVKGERWSAEQTPSQMALMREHLAYLRRNIEQKRYVFAGPMLDWATSRAQGILVLSAPSAEEARRLVGDDPAVRAGYFAVELHPAMLPSLAGVDVRY
jgi:uncharacterized protein YciI